MAQQIYGRIHLVKPTKQISENFSKREFVIKTDEQYPQLIQVELQHDNVYLIDNFNVGDEVIVSINFKGRAWKNPEGEEVYFNTIVAWKILRPDTDKQTPAPVVQNTAPPPENATHSPSPTTNEEDPDDLPF
ncbi:MAG TPA: DUF3127 domain-containing protein [Flavobacterium sp.]